MRCIKMRTGQSKEGTNWKQKTTEEEKEAMKEYK
jgi:hypothetical protein